MSIAINPSNVTAILVGGQWIDILPDTMYFDAYEYVEPGEEEYFTHVGGHPSLSSTGFTAKTSEETHIAGSITMLQAVRYGITNRPRPRRK